MSWTGEFEGALASAEPFKQLCGKVVELVEGGADREELVQQLTALANERYEDGREDDHDTIADLLDYLTGWCSPGTEI